MQVYELASQTQRGNYSSLEMFGGTQPPNIKSDDAQAPLPPPHIGYDHFFF